MFVANGTLYRVAFFRGQVLLAITIVLIMYAHFRFQGNSAKYHLNKHDLLFSLSALCVHRMLHIIRRPQFGILYYKVLSGMATEVL